jgi:GT2 family glycosyltransferase
MSSYNLPAAVGSANATGAESITIGNTAATTNNNGNLTDSAGNLQTDFVWGNFPAQPNDERADGTPTATMMAKKNDLIALGGFDESLRRVEDIDLALRAGLKGFSFKGTTQKVVVRYDSIGSDKIPSLNYKAELYLVKKYKRELRDLGIYLKTYLWFHIRDAYFNKRFVSLGMYFFLFALMSPKYFIKKIMSSIPQRFIHELNMRKSDRNQTSMLFMILNRL